MAGGMMVLGSIVAGPALAIFGHILGNKGEEALNNAYSNMEQAKTINAQSILIVEKLQAIEQVTTLANKTFSLTSSRLRGAVRQMKESIENYGENFPSFPQESKENVFLSVKYAQLVKAMLDTPILDHDGNLVLSTEKRILDISAVASGKKSTLDTLAA